MSVKKWKKGSGKKCLFQSLVDHYQCASRTNNVSKSITGVEIDTAVLEIAGGDETICALQSVGRLENED